MTADARRTHGPQQHCIPCPEDARIAVLERRADNHHAELHAIKQSVDQVHGRITEGNKEQASQIADLRVALARVAVACTIGAAVGAAALGALTRWIVEKL